MAELLFWPALLAYGEAAFAYAGDRAAPGLMGRLATWGVRIGWLVQTALLIAQAVRADGFPWDTWAGSLNLFVWLVVGAYLIWGCRPRYRLLGLVVMARSPRSCSPCPMRPAGDASGKTGYSTLFLVLHVGPARGLRRLHASGCARGALPLAGAAAQAAQLDGASLPRALARDARVARRSDRHVLVAGAHAGHGCRVRPPAARRGLDPLIVLTVLTWTVYGAFLILRFGIGWRGRRAAYTALVGFALVIALQLSLQTGHFG